MRGRGDGGVDDYRCFASCCSYPGGRRLDPDGAHDDYRCTYQGLSREGGAPNVSGITWSCGGIPCGYRGITGSVGGRSSRSRGTASRRRSR